MEIPSVGRNENIQDIEQTWQDNWPSIAYDIDYKHQKYGQIDPQQLTYLMRDMGIEGEAVPNLTLVVSKRLTGSHRGEFHNRGSLDLRPSMRDWSASSVIKILPGKSERKNTGYVMHEMSHYRDEVRDAHVESMKFRSEQMKLGAMTGVIGTLAIELLRHNDPSTILHSTAETPLKAAGLAVAGVGLYCGAKIGSYVAYRSLGSERRAHKAQKHTRLMRRYQETLFS